MNKKIKVAAFLFLIILCVGLASGWYHSAHSNRIQKDMAQQGAIEAYDSFVRYKETKDEVYYSYAVSAYYYFEQSYRLVDDREYLTTNSVYAFLVQKPEDCQTHIDEIIEAMKILSEDVTHPNGYQKLAYFENSLRSLIRFLNRNRIYN